MVVAESGRRRGERAHHLQHRLEQVDVDDLAPAAVEGDHRGEGGGQRGDLVGEGHRREEGLAVLARFAIEAGEPAHGFGEGGEAGASGVGARLAEAGDPGHDEVRAAGEQDRGRVEAQPLQGAGPEVLDEHVGGVDEAEERVAFGRRLEVEGDRALVAPDQLPPEGDVVVGVPPAHAPGAVTAAVGTLDLDDVGPEVPEVPRRPGAGDDGGQVEHPDVGERAVRGRGAGYWRHAAIVVRAELVGVALRRGRAGCGTRPRPRPGRGAVRPASPRAGRWPAAGPRR